MNITYKEINCLDLSRIKEIYKSCGWQSYLNDDKKLNNAFENTLFLYGAYDENLLVGFVRCVGDGEHIVLVQDLIVEIGYQMNGIGTYLFKYAMEKYDSARAFLVITDMYDDVDNKFYQKHCFKKIEEKQMVAYIR